MGDVVDFVAKAGEETKELVACGGCDSMLFLITTDGTVICSECRFPISDVTLIGDSE